MPAAAAAHDGGDAAAALTAGKQPQSHARRPAVPLTYLFLAIGAFQTGAPPHALTQVGGWFGILTGLAAWYASAATVIDEAHGRTLLPVGLRRPGAARRAPDERLA